MMIWGWNRRGRYGDLVVDGRVTKLIWNRLWWCVFNSVGSVQIALADSWKHYNK